MAGSKYLTCNPDTMPGDADLSFAFKASVAGVGGGGGITVVAATLSTGLVGTFDIILQNYGTSGTVAGGTIAGMASGTATVWAADTPQSLTLTAAQVFVDAGEVIMIKKVESAAGNDLSADAAVVIEYVDGVGLVG